MKRKIFPVILCGGIGKRLWPLSRQSYPKQFSKFLGPHSLFQNTVVRFNDPRFEPPLILTCNEYRFIIEDQLNELRITCSGIIIEPCTRDTAPAILAASMYLNQISENPIMIILPSDHTVGNEKELKSLIYYCTPFSEAGEIVTFGIKPNRNETGYGWIEPSEKIMNSDLHRVKSFHEKPTKGKAEKYITAGNYLWNSGIYLATSETFIHAYNKHSIDLFHLVSTSVKNLRNDLGFIRLEEVSWERIEPISVDYAILEKVSNILVAKYEFGWDDLGDWNAVWRENKKDIYGVSSIGSVFSIDCKNSYLRSESPYQQLVALGCDDMIVVSMPDAVLVSKKEYSQTVKDAVVQLQESGKYQSWKFPVENRPWGKFESLLTISQVQINRLIIQPGKKIVLHRHDLRSEHWVVIKGIATITLENRKIILKENQSMDIPIGTKHSLNNATKLPLVVIEVQTGPCLDSVDIERFEIL